MASAITRLLIGRRAHATARTHVPGRFLGRGDSLPKTCKIPRCGNWPAGASRRIATAAKPAPRQREGRATRWVTAWATAIGTLGLGGRPKLNGEAGFAIGFDSGRYRVRLTDSAPSDKLKPLGISLANRALDPGTAVIVEGLISQPKWNGRRLLVESVDEEQGRYRLLVKGRARPLGVKLDCCKLQSLVTQGREPQESVRAALVARGTEPEPEHSPL